MNSPASPVFQTADLHRGAMMRMRTTIDLTPEAWHLAKAVAREREQSLGQVVSDFILRVPVAPAPLQATSEAGFPLLRIGRAITADDVRRLTDEDAE